MHGVHRCGYGDGYRYGATATDGSTQAHPACHRVNVAVIDRANRNGSGLQAIALTVGLRES